MPGSIIFATSASLVVNVSTHHEGVGHRRLGQIDPHGFLLGVGGPRVDPALAPVAAVLEAADRRHGRDGAVGVDPDDARAHVAGQAVGATEIAGPDAGGEAELRVVGHGQGFDFILETDHRGNRAEDFFLHDFHRVAVAFEQGRLVVPAVTVNLWALAAQAQFRPFGQGVGDQAFDHGQLLRGGHRTHLAAVILRVADADALGTGDQALDELVIDLVLYQQARAGYAALPGGCIDAGDRAVDRTVQVGVGEDDIRRLAAQLQ